MVRTGCAGRHDEKSQSITNEYLLNYSITRIREGGAIWKAGDQYQIHRPLILLDQPGRGQSDVIVGAPPVNRATGKAAWPHQALEPSYSWNDIYTPTGESVNFKTGAGNHKLQQEGRDYYNNTPMPGYKPYTYPHPLVSGGASKHAQPGKLDDRPASTREW